MMIKVTSKLLLATAATFSILSIPTFANEDQKGQFYVTGGIGGSQIADIDVIGSSSDLEFEASLGLDLGLGYDFGKTRLEGVWVRGGSEKTTYGSNTIALDTQLDSLMATYYYDWRDTKKWSPFLGASIGVTQANVDNIDDSGFSWGFAYGLSYKTSENTDVFYKGNIIITPELDFGNITIENGVYGTGTIGVRHRFNF